MSNTIRRKSKIIKSSSWVLWDRDTYIGYMQYGSFTKDSKEGRKAIAVYHSDAGVGDLWYKSNCQWMRKADHKKHSRNCEQAIHRFFNGIDEDVILPTYKHCWLD